MLPKEYSFTVYNDCGVNIVVGISASRKKIANNGSIEYESTPTTIYTNHFLADGTYDTSSIIDNSTDLYIGGDFLLQIVPSGVPSGDVIVYFNRNVGASDDPGLGDIVCIISPSSIDIYRKTFEL